MPAARLRILIVSVLLVPLVAFAIGLRPPVSITDQRGKTFVFTEPARRVVTIAIPLFWTFMTVDGSESRVVGANAVATAQMRDGIVDRIFPHAATVPTTITRGGTFTPNIEALLALRPDAIFQWADRGDELIDVLDRTGLRALGVKNTSSESDIDAWIRMSGVVAGREERAESIIQWMQTGNHRFDSMTASIPAANRPRVLALTEYSHTITANGPTSYAGISLQRAGGVNAATVDGTVSIEQVLRWESRRYSAVGLRDRSIRPISSPILSGRKHRRQKVDASTNFPFGVTRWGGYGPESPLFLGWLTSLLYPDRFNIPLRDEMRAAYQMLFHYAATDDDLNRVLQMDENGASVAA